MEPAVSSVVEENPNFYGINHFLLLNRSEKRAGS